MTRGKSRKAARLTGPWFAPPRPWFAPPRPHCAPPNVRRTLRAVRFFALRRRPASRPTACPLPRRRAAGLALSKRHPA